MSNKDILQAFCDALAEMVQVSVETGESEAEFIILQAHREMVELKGAFDYTGEGVDLDDTSIN